MAVTKKPLRRKTTKKNSSKLAKLARLFNPRSLKGGMMLFALVFALAGGGYYAYRSFASTILTMSMVKTADNAGYYLLEVDGGIKQFGSAAHRGSPLNDKVTGKVFVDMAMTASGSGYWVLAESGKVYAYGDAAKLVAPESTGPYVAIVATPGQGFWLVNKLGIVLAYGDAKTTYNLDTTKKNYTDGGFGTIKDVKAIVDADKTLTNGLVMLDTNGKVYHLGNTIVFGDASSSLTASGETAVSIAAGDTHAYLITTSKGRIIAQGSGVNNKGGLTDQSLPAPIASIAKFGNAQDNSNGYWLVTLSGKVYAFGAAKHYGDTSVKPLTQVYVPPKPAPAPATTSTPSPSTNTGDSNDSNEVPKTEDGLPAADPIICVIVSNYYGQATSWYNSVTSIRNSLIAASDKYKITGEPYKTQTGTMWNNIALARQAVLQQKNKCPGLRASGTASGFMDSASNYYRDASEKFEEWSNVIKLVRRDASR